MSDLIAVKYVRNADDSSGTGAIRFNNDDRSDIPIGGLGVVSEEEFTRLNAFGYILERVDGDEAKQARSLSGTEEEQRSLSDLKREELEDIAREEGVDTKGLRKNADVVKAIEEKRSGVEEGEESLPATATQTGGGAPALGGGAAGPGGSPPAGAAGPGGGTTA